MVALMAQVERKVVRIITAHRQVEGGGFVVRRPLPSRGFEDADPFLLIDEMGPVDYAPGEAVGAPDHPHRGFETITYMVEGAFEHKDSAGHRGQLNAGDVQWMTAGSGVIHSELPSESIQKNGGRVHGFQIWVNLPASLKMTPPRYQEVPASRIPQGEQDRASVKVVAGEALGVKAVIDTHTPILYHDWTLRAGADTQVQIPTDHTVLVYVFQGELRVGGEGLQDGQLAVTQRGEFLHFSVDQNAEKDARFLVLGGLPLNEPIVRYGPFVMNTREQILEALDDFRSGRLGRTMIVVDAPT